MVGIVEAPRLAARSAWCDWCEGRVEADHHQATLDALALDVHGDCFICAEKNLSGLRVRFFAQADGSVAACFACRELFRGYPDRLHGGVISALLDAAMTNALFARGVVAVTAELTVRFVEPVALGQPALVRAHVEKTARSLYFARAELVQNGVCMARASAKFVAKGSRRGHR